MWHVCDSLDFTYKKLSGDGSITAKIESINPTHYTTQVGLMIRSTLESTSPNASVVVTSLGDVVFRYRAIELGAVLSRYATIKAKLPCWLRLKRKGDRFTAGYSSNGTNWENVENETSGQDASIEIPMNETVHIGLAISSANPNHSEQARIMQLTVQGLVEPDGPFTKSDHIGLLEEISTTLY